MVVVEGQAITDFESFREGGGAGEWGVLGLTFSTCFGRAAGALTRRL